MNPFASHILSVTRARLSPRPFQVGAINTPGVNALQLLPEDPDRVYFFIQNNSAANMLIGLDSSPQSAQQCIVLGPGNFWEPNVAPINAIYALSASLPRANGIVIQGTVKGSGNVSGC